MNRLYDYDIYYNGELLSDIIYIDDNFELMDNYFIKIEYIKDERLTTIIDSVDEFRFVKHQPMIERLG